MRKDYRVAAKKWMLVPMTDWSVARLSVSGIPPEPGGKWGNKKRENRSNEAPSIEKYDGRKSDFVPLVVSSVESPRRQPK